MRDDTTRKPLAKMESPEFPVPESRDERITVRLKSSERAMFLRAALAEGVEVSRYIRDCAVMGHTIRRAHATLKATGG